MTGESICPHEAAVLTAVGSGSMPEDVATHLSGCERCREAVFMMRQLTMLSAQTAPPVSPIEAQRIWLKVRLAQKQKVSRRLEKTVSAIAALVAVGCVGGTALWGWPQIAHLLTLGLAPAVVLGAIAFVLLFTQELVVSD